MDLLLNVRPITPTNWEYYSLSDFDMREVEIVEQIEDEGLDLSM